MYPAQIMDIVKIALLKRIKRGCLFVCLKRYDSCLASRTTFWLKHIGAVSLLFDRVLFHLFQVSDIEFVEGFVRSGFVGSSWNTTAPAEKKDWVWWIWCATYYDDNDTGNGSWWWWSWCFTDWQGYECVFQFFNLTKESIHGTLERNPNVLTHTRYTDICGKSSVDK